MGGRCEVPQVRGGDAEGVVGAVSADKIVALIDGDIFAYKAACVNETSMDLGDDVFINEADPEKAKSNVEDLINHITTRLFADETIVCLTGPMKGVSGRNFRKELYPDYKGNRKAEKPVLLPTVKEHIRSAFNTKVKDGIEADDTIGILMTHPKLIPGKRICVSIDKDLLQIPGRHFNPDTGNKKMVSTVKGDLFFLRQTLTGDPTDNYPGLRNVGPKRAATIIQDALDANAHLAGNAIACVWPAIVTAYEDRGFTEADALVQARCARILRHTDYDFKRKEPILWTP